MLTALKSAGLYDYFDFVISCSEVGSGKERPDVYFKALELLGSSVEDTCVVEDAYVALETAKSIGLKTVGVFDNDNVAFQDRVKASSDIYLGEGHGLEELINIIE